MSSSIFFARPSGVLTLCAGLVASLAACVAPENPCDSAAERAVRQTASLSGIVLDQDDNPVAGVTVLLSEQSRTTVSAEDGTFVLLDLLPNEGELGYELSAVPMPPVLGGVVRVAPLGCRAQIEDIVLRVARPPAAPATDLVKATAEDRLLVGFPTVVSPTREQDEATFRYRIELRVPFGNWESAWLTCDAAAAARPWEEIHAADPAYQTSIADACAREHCAAFEGAAPGLQAPSARCAHVVGLVDESAPGGYAPLAPHGSYFVRVVSERSSDKGVTDQQLPAILYSPETSSFSEVSLVPTSWAEVPLAAAPEEHANRVGQLDVECIFGFGEGRFAMLDPRHAGGVRVLSFAELTSGFGQGAGVDSGTLVYDENQTLMMADELARTSATPISMLTHGNWLRVLSRVQTTEGGASSVRVAKVFLGSESESDPALPRRPEPTFEWDLSRVQFRDFAWLNASDAAEADDPSDAYILLFRRGFILWERASSADAPTAFLARNLATWQQRAGYLGIDAATWVPSTGGGQPGVLGGLCEDLNERGGHDRHTDDSTDTRICVNLARASEGQVDLQGLAMLPAESNDLAFSSTVHVFLDAASDRALVFPTDALFGETDAPLADTLREVPLGSHPWQMQKSAMLSCEEDASYAQPVLLVANRDSQDVSMLALSGTAERDVVEVARISLPTAPSAFMLDEGGPDCGSPYAWVILADGRVVPIDMRSDKLAVPFCQEAPCAVQVKGKRLRTGAIRKDAAGRPRMVFGGGQILGEAGFLRAHHATHYGQ